MKLGAYTACVADKPLGAALDTLKELGLTSVEPNTGGFIPSPHCPVEALLASSGAREAYLAEFSQRGLELTALNCNGNPLSPRSTGAKHAEDLRKSIRLAGLLGVPTVITMSGLPGSDATAKYPNWVVNPWDNVYSDVLDYQWQVGVEFWKDIDHLATECGVKVALELHPHNIVFNVSTAQRLFALVGGKNLGVEMDTSHLMWQQMDVVSCIEALGDRVFVAAAKDVKLFDGVRTKGVLDVDFTRVPADSPDKVPTGYGSWCNAWPQNPAWRFVAVGIGHDVDYWADVMRALITVNPDIAFNIEHEDAQMSTADGLAMAVSTLQAAQAKL